jgi:hypothetical protein
MKTNTRITATGSSGRKNSTTNKSKQARTKVCGEKRESKMKTLTVMVSLFLLFVISTTSYSATYRLFITEPVRTAPNTIEFSIRLQNTSTDETVFRYSIGQYFLLFNPAISNGGQLKYTLLESGLPEKMMPRNPMVKGDLLMLACNEISDEKKSLPEVPASPEGLLITKMRLETSAASFAGDSPNIRWADASSTFRTKLFVYDGSSNIDITNISNHVIGDGNGIINYQELSGLPTGFELSQNFPNPFNPTTTIKFSIPQASLVTLKVFDISGKEVITLVNERRDAGNYDVSFNGAGLSSGMYFYRINAGSFTKVMKMVLVK